MSIVYSERRDTRELYRTRVPASMSMAKKMYRTSTCITFVWTHVHRDNGFSEVGQKKLTGEMHIV